ncbi:MAG: zf-HC2 domain-containing protein [Armatimonadetes bacterium]|nr:zf-HC2 domain-containing protein [Armatimonadota bacterium]
MSETESYTCEDAFNKLDDFLDRELSPEEIELVQKHLNKCAQCAEAYDFEGSMLQCVRRKIERLDLPSELLGRISKALEEADRP